MGKIKDQNSIILGIINPRRCRALETKAGHFRSDRRLLIERLRWYKTCIGCLVQLRGGTHNLFFNPSDSYFSWSKRCGGLQLLSARKLLGCFFIFSLFFSDFNSTQNLGILNDTNIEGTAGRAGNRKMKGREGVGNSQIKSTPLYDLQQMFAAKFKQLILDLRVICLLL